MDAEAWVSSCTARLMQRWPGVGAEDLGHLAHALWADRAWQAMEPAAAAERWLQAQDAASPQGCGGSPLPDERIRSIPPHTRPRRGFPPARRESGECR